MSWRAGTVPLDEIPEFYHTYLSGIPGGDVVGLLTEELADTLRLLGGVPEALETHRYAPDRWTLRDVVGHLADIERIFGFRALTLSRGDPAALPGMEQDDYAREARASERPLASLLDEFEHLRRANVALFGSWDDEAALRRGIANGVEFTARAFAWITLGHERHHKRVLREKYLDDE